MSADLSLLVGQKIIGVREYEDDYELLLLLESKLILGISDRRECTYIEYVSPDNLADDTLLALGYLTQEEYNEKHRERLKKEKEEKLKQEKERAEQKEKRDKAAYERLKKKFENS